MNGQASFGYVVTMKVCGCNAYTKKTLQNTHEDCTDYTVTSLLDFALFVPDSGGFFLIIPWGSSAGFGLGSRNPKPSVGSKIGLGFLGYERCLDAINCKRQATFIFCSNNLVFISSPNSRLKSNSENIHKHGTLSIIHEIHYKPCYIVINTLYNEADPCNY